MPAFNAVHNRLRTIPATPMLFTFKKRDLPWVMAWVLASLLGALWLGKSELTRLNEVFSADVRIAHRLLSQRVVQQEAILATLALLGGTEDSLRPEQRLPALYPQILSVQRRDRDAPWTDLSLQAAETESRRLGRAVLASIDMQRGRYQLLQAAQPNSFAMLIDIRSMVPWNEWPMAPDTSPVQVTLLHAGQSMRLQGGTGTLQDTHHWRFRLDKALAAESQPFLLTAEQHVAWTQLPWWWMAGYALMVAGVLLAARNLITQRRERHRAQELLRLGQVARLNTLGELAAGMAHELNQPLTAVLGNAQAASRLLAEDAPDLPLVRSALNQAVGQARRAAEVVQRLRRAVEQPQLGDQLQALALQALVDKALYLMEPELKRHQIGVSMTTTDSALKVLAEPVALEQILHNLLMNAVQALAQVPAGNRKVRVDVRRDAGRGRLSVSDNGPGIPADVLPRVFEPFFTSRADGLGLGLSLCETLTASMSGALTARNGASGGAEFCLSLPLALGAPGTA